ncbi:hypothetical protein C8Q80DRAFT_371938 [Daedaleopsis nitida]|nr:hypothetical protein C8Q80DRAFT_371938 [Daedaleopsis nitida]
MQREDHLGRPTDEMHAIGQPHPALGFRFNHLHGLATRVRLQEPFTRRQARMLGMWEQVPWRVEMPWSREGVMPSPLYVLTLGSIFLTNTTFLNSTPILLHPYGPASTRAYLRFIKHSPQRTAPLSETTQTNSSKSFSTNSQPGDTSDRSPNPNSKPQSDPFKRPRSLSFPNPTSQTRTVWSRTSHTQEPRRPSYPQSIITSTRTGSLAHGEPSQRFASCAGGFHRVLKAPSATWPKRTTPFLSPSPSGRARSYGSHNKTSSPWTRAPHSGSALMRDCTESSRTLSVTLPEGKVSARCRSGSMTRSSFASSPPSSQTTTRGEPSGGHRSFEGADDTMRAVASGSGEICSKTDEPTSSSRTWSSPSAIYPGARPGWEYHGNGRKTSRSPPNSLSRASSGTSARKEPSAYREPKRTNMSAPLTTGCRVERTLSRRSRSSTANSGMRLWSLLQDERFSPHWRPCWGSSVIVRSCHELRPPKLQTTFVGGETLSATQSSNATFLDRLSYGTLWPSQTPAPKWASASSSKVVGEHGDSSQAGSRIAGTSAGQRRSDSNFLPTPSFRLLTAHSQTYKSTVTTGEWSKVGGAGEAGTSKSTKCSSESSKGSTARGHPYTRDTSKAPSIQQTDLRAGSTHRDHGSFLPFPFQTQSHASSSTSTPHYQPRKDVSERKSNHPEPNRSSLGPPRNGLGGAPETSVLKPKNSGGKPPTGSTTKIGRFNAPIVRAENTGNSRPRPYRADLAPQPSALRPHCLAQDRLLSWRPLASRRPVDRAGSPVAMSEEDIAHITEVTAHAWEPSTASTYGSGLLVYHVLCDIKGIPEQDRAPASFPLIQLYVASLAGSYAPSAVKNYVLGVRAWHIVHGLAWQPDKLQLEAIIDGASKLAPESSKRKPRDPFTVDILAQLAPHFDLSRPVDAATWACITFAFYSLARLGELTVKNEAAFKKSLHPARSSLRQDHHRDGSEVKVVALPRTKIHGRRWTSILP